MRIAVMADIHSNHIALEACIAEAKQRHAEEFLFLGDYLGELAYPEKTLELLGWIRSQYPCAFIRGNKEEYWINHKNGKHGDWVWESGKSGSGMLAYIYGRLTPEQIEEFERMPISKVMRYYGYLQGHGLIVSWCLGHLVASAVPEDYDPKYKVWRYEDLPIFPDEWKYKVISQTGKQFAVLKKLMHDPAVTEIVCATDAGREGELIFRLVYEMAGCKLPVRRLWISSLEKESIEKGFSNLKSASEYDNLYKAALCREHADWLVGMNATRLYSMLYGRTLKVGRVMSPTLAMIVNREDNIRSFVPEKFYTVQLESGISVASERFSNREDENPRRPWQTRDASARWAVRKAEATRVC